MQGIAYFIVGCVFVVCLCGKGSEIIWVLQAEKEFLSFSEKEFYA